MHFHSIDSLKKEITTRIISACFPEREREREIFPPKIALKNKIAKNGTHFEKLQK
jgi:hypothetical protein